MRTLTRRVVGGGIAVAVLAASLNASIPLVAQAADEVPIVVDTVQGRDGALLQDMVIDVLPFGEPGKPVRFTPDQHEYTATAYYHTNTVSLRTIAAQGAQVTVNGKAVDANGRASVDLKPAGQTTNVVVRVADQTYTVAIHKVDTDFRGNVKIPVSAAKGNGATDADNKALFDDNQDTGWTPASINRNNEWSDSVTGFTLSLDKARYVSRITGWGSIQVDNTQEQKDEAQKNNKKATVPAWWPGSNVSIAVQSADGQWTTVATHASLRRDQGGIYYWDLGKPYEAKNIRVWLNPSVDAEMNNAYVFNSVTFKDFELWGLPEGETPEAAPALPTNDSYDPTADMAAWGVDRAQALAMHYGILIPAWVPSEDYARGVMDGNEQNLAGPNVIPQFYDPPLFNKPAMESMGNDSYWSIAKAPTGGNSLDAETPLEDFLTDEMQPYRGNLVEIQYGDEGEYSEAQVELFKKWFEFSKNEYPGAIVHSNQYTDLTWAANAQHYVQTAQPDMLLWDRYYFQDDSAMNPSETTWAHFKNEAWQSYREAASKGLTGDGSQPILYGQYIDYNWNDNLSESQKALTPMLGLASGQKFLGGFRMEQVGYDRGSLFDFDGAPTTAFYEFSEIFNDVHSFGDYLTPFNNTYVATVPGTYNGTLNKVKTGWNMNSFTSTEAWAKNAEYGVANVSVQNRGTVNNGEPGDVVLGYFDKLPNLADSKTSEVYGAGVTNPKGIMVVNGLVGQTPKTDLLKPRNDNGAYWQTAQDITLTLAAPTDTAKLMVVDPVTGKVSQANPLVSGDTAQVTLRLGGGEGALLYWTAPNPVVNGSAPAAPNPYAAVGTPFHPQSVVADSEELTGETAPNGTVAALIDGTDTEPNVASFWHTQWKVDAGQTVPAFPHGIVASTNGKQVCGAVVTARQGKTEGPKGIAFYYGDNANPEVKKPDAKGDWAGFTVIGSAQMNASGETVIPFGKAVDAAAIGLGLFSSQQDNVAYAHMADLRLLECDPNAPQQPSAQTNLYHPTSVVYTDSNAEQETAPSGRPAALIDGTATQPTLSTFWHSSYNPVDPFPHAVVVAQDQPAVCGVLIRPRESTEEGQTPDLPKNISVYTRNANQDGTYPEGNIAKPVADGKTWEGFTKVQDAVVLEAGGVVTFEAPVEASQIGFAFWDNHSGQAFTSISDLSLVKCDQEPAEGQVRVTVNPNGGTLPAGVSAALNVQQGQAIGTLPTPTRPGYTLAGWNTVADGSGTAVDAATVAEEAITVYAQWEANTTGLQVPTQFPHVGDAAVVTLDANGGALPEGAKNTVDAVVGDAVGELPTPTRTPGEGDPAKAYVFTGWNTNKDGSGETFTKDTVVTSAITLYAQFAVQAETIQPGPELTVKDTTITVGDQLDLKTLITAAKVNGEDATAAVQIDKGDFDPAKAGTYTVTFTLTQGEGDKAIKVTKTATVTVKDKEQASASAQPSVPSQPTQQPTEQPNPTPGQPGGSVNAPTVTLEVTDGVVAVGSNVDLTDLIVKAEVNGKAAAGSVTVDKGNFDPSKPGTYQVTFTLSAEGAAPVTKTVTVTVTADANPVKPGQTAGGKTGASDSGQSGEHAANGKALKSGLSATGATAGGIAVGAIALLAAGAALARRRRS